MKKLFILLLILFIPFAFAVTWEDNNIYDAVDITFSGSLSGSGASLTGLTISQIGDIGSNYYSQAYLDSMFNGLNNLSIEYVTLVNGNFSDWDKDYNDLTNKPNIPSDISELDNDLGYFNSSNIGSTYPNLDTDSTDDLSLITLDNASIIRTVNTSWVTDNQNYNTSDEIFIVCNNDSFYPYSENPNSYLTSESDSIAIGLMQGNESDWLSTYNETYDTNVDTNETDRVDELYSNISNFLAQDGYEADTNETTRMDEVYANITNYLSTYNETYDANIDTNETNRVDELYSNISAFLQDTTYSALSEFEDDVGYFTNIANFTGTLTDSKYCIYSTGTGIVCNSEGGSGGNTTEEIQDVIGGLLVDSTKIDIRYSDGGNYMDLYLFDNAINDDELNYSDVTLNDFTNDAGYLRNGTLTNAKICIWDEDNSLINCTYTDLLGEGGTSKTGDSIYLYNDSDTIYFNETKLNLSIGAKIITDVDDTLINNLFTDDLTVDLDTWNTTDEIFAVCNNDSFYLASNPNEYISSESDSIAIGLMQGNESSWLSTYNETYDGNIDTNETTRMDAVYSNISNYLSTFNQTYQEFNETYTNTLYYSQAYLNLMFGGLNNLSITDVNNSNGNWSQDKDNYYVKSEVYTQAEIDNTTIIRNSTTMYINNNKICLNDGCTAYMNSTCRVYPNGAKEGSSC